MRNITEVKKSVSVSFKDEEVPHSRFERWMKYPSTTEQVNLPQLRILGLLFDEDQTRGSGYTKSQIVAMLKIWEDQADNLLDQLHSHELLYSEQIPFGMDLFSRQRKVRVYHITEVGRFYHHQLDS